MPKESLKQFDKFLNCKLFLIDTLVNKTLLKPATEEELIKTLKDVSKICQASYKTIVNYMENKQ